MTTTAIRKSEVGELRPSQILTTFGVGAMVDLPHLSVMVMGLDDWPTQHSQEITEERLLLSVQKVLGPQVQQLLSPPQVEETFGAHANWFDEAHQVGVPVAPFPRWMVCSSCRLLAPVHAGLFEPRVEAFHPDRARYVHNCTTRGRAPAVVPARFVAACEKGHLGDFPWLEFLHGAGSGCKGPLFLYEVGPSGEAADIQVECKGCGKRRRMAEAFGAQNVQQMPPCEGRSPHLRSVDPEGCGVEHVTPILQGASNSWFPVMLSVLSVPQAADKLAQLVEENWSVLDRAQNQQNIELLRQVGQLRDFSEYSVEQVWEAVQKRRQGGGAAGQEPDDLKTPEWKVCSRPGSVPESRDFRLQAVEPPDDYARFFEKIVLAEKLREVKALVGFTRIESARDFDTPFDVPAEMRAPLSRRAPTWVPASETRGEGIFLQFAEAALAEWVGRVRGHADEFVRAHKQWRASKGLDPGIGFPGMRYALLHTFGHALIRQLSVECGYTTASIAERVYSRDPDEDGPTMAGVLIYTAAPDSEGTLGGLCALGRPHQLGRHIDQALDRMRLCSSDPLCAEHLPTIDTTLHAAACHACTFLPETSCERGNKYLDRSLLVDTVERTGLAFFE